MKNDAISFLGLLATLVSCVDSGRVMPSVTGTSYEVLVVMDNKYWQGAEGDSIRAYMAADMGQMPQVEPLFTISQVNKAEFSNILKPVRNIILAEIDSAGYTQAKVVYMKNTWAKPQAVVRITAPDGASFREALGLYGKNIVKYFVQSEIERQVAFYKGYTNHAAQKKVMEMFGVQMNIPNDVARMTTDTDFFWITDSRTSVRRDIVVYSYPYTDPNTFTKEFLLAKRDSVMKHHIPGEFEGSYMGTEYKHIPPVFNEISVNGNYCAEIRGLWKMMNGSAMGGPFISHTRLDEINQRVITMEVFVFAPGEKKRNPLRQLEAVLYSARLPQEINELPEVSVKAASGDSIETTQSGK